MAERLRVLLVEDDEADAELTRLALEAGGFELEWQRVDTAEAFVRAFDEREWDAVISDFAMPSFDGIQAFTLFLERRLDIPFVFVSGALGEERAVEAMLAGARDYLLKGQLGRLAVAVRRELRAAESRRQQSSAEEDSRRHQRRLRLAVEVSGGGVFESPLPADDRTYISERCAQLLGVRATELPAPARVFDWLVGLVHADEREAVVAACHAFALGESDALRLEVRVGQGPGRWLDLDVRARADARDADGRVTQLVGVVLDLTEQKRLATSLRQAQKMEAIGRLAGGVAHDFNNLLTAIFAFGSFVMDGLGPDSPLRDDMHEVLMAARRAASLTGQMLAFSRLKKTSPRIVDVNEVVTNLERMLRRLLDADVDMRVRLTTDGWRVTIDPAELEQVLVNLTVNARDAMLHGGKLTLETGRVSLKDGAPELADSGLGAGDYVVIAVSDTGTGMDAATLQRLFEPFFTTKAVGRGTGLGLSTCYGIVKQAGGFIGVQSELGRGSTFKVYLPRATGTEVAAEALPPRAELAGSETVLVVEDDPHVRELVVRTLTHYGYTVLRAANGHEALALGAQTVKPIALLLTDIVMPQLGGLDLAARLSVWRPDLRVLLMSGYAADTVDRRGDITAETRLLSKPFTPEMLAREVRATLDAPRPAVPSAS
ncbi:MAG: response regulator [Myxococcota bacterium]